MQASVTFFPRLLCTRARLAEALKPGYRCTHHQENYFFDGANQARIRMWS